MNQGWKKKNIFNLPLYDPDLAPSIKRIWRVVIKQGGSFYIYMHEHSQKFIKMEKPCRIDDKCGLYDDQ
jgi:hypothetical protein